MSNPNQVSISISIYDGLIADRNVLKRIMEGKDKVVQTIPVLGYHSRWAIIDESELPGVLDEVQKELHVMLKKSDAIGICYKDSYEEQAKLSRQLANEIGLGYRACLLWGSAIACMGFIVGALI